MSWVIFKTIKMKWKMWKKLWERFEMKRKRFFILDCFLFDTEIWMEMKVKIKIEFCVIFRKTFFEKKRRKKKRKREKTKTQNAKNKTLINSNFLGKTPNGLKRSFRFFFFSFWITFFGFILCYICHLLIVFWW